MDQRDAKKYALGIAVTQLDAYLLGDDTSFSEKDKKKVHSEVRKIRDRLRDRLDVLNTEYKKAHT
jgi:hypothetical protein